MTANVETMAYVGRTPWWVGIESGIANELPANATTDDIIGPAGLDWDPVFAPVVVNGREVATHRAVTRSDTGDVLGLVGGYYTPFSNREMLEFGDTLVDDGGAKWTTAGVLKGGATVWGLAELPKHVRIEGDPSDIKPYLLLTNGHDGRTAFGAFITPQRVVCENTLRAARIAAQAHIYIRHTQGLTNRVGEARRTLRIAFEYLDTWQTVMTTLSQRAMSARDFEAFVTKLIPVKDKDNIPTRTQNVRDQLINLYASSPTLEGVTPTAYRAFNVVAEYADHFRTYQNTKATSAIDNRALSNIDGRGQGMKDAALALLLPKAALAAAR
jgi:phage/plasmid-like protein (TIGR03299 family)